MKIVTLYEESYLILSTDGKTHNSDGNCARLNSKHFAFFENKASAKNAQWIAFAEFGKKRALRIQRFAGNVLFSDNLCFEILPKTAKFTGDEDARNLFIRMLSAVPGYESLERSRASAKRAKGPLLDVFLSEFVRETQGVIKGGLMGNFTAVESNEVFCKGKLLLPLHIRHNAIEKQRFFTEHDEFLLDRPENRILKSALLSIRRLSSQRTLTSEAAKLLAHFDEVPLTRDPAGDFARVTHDRNTAHYRTALHWAKIILSAAGPIPTPGDLEIPALLFPMEKLFEAFVAREIKVALRNCPHLYLASQNAVHFLVHHGAERWFLLRPDLVIYDRRKGYSPLMVLDTKWKLLDKNDFRFNLSQSDFQQLLCYGLTTLKGKGQLALIYPKTPHFPPSPEVCTFPMEAARELTLTIEAYDLKSGAFGSDALRDKILRLEENSPGASENNQAAY